MAHILGMVQYNAGRLRESAATLQSALNLAVELGLSETGVQNAIVGALKLTRSAIERQKRDRIEK